jgi:hypothetical protein
MAAWGAGPRRTLPFGSLCETREASRRGRGAVPRRSAKDKREFLLLSEVREGERRMPGQVRSAFRFLQFGLEPLLLGFPAVLLGFRPLVECRPLRFNLGNNILVFLPARRQCPFGF